MVWEEVCLRVGILSLFWVYTDCDNLTENFEKYENLLEKKQYSVNENAWTCNNIKLFKKGFAIISRRLFKYGSHC